MDRKLLSLEEISQDYTIVLIDTSALISPIVHGDGNLEMQSMQVESARFYTNFFIRGNSFYVTPMVLSEYKRDPKNFSRFNREESKLYTQLKNHKLFNEVLSAENNFIDEKKKFVRSLIDGERVIKLDESTKSVYKNFFDLYKPVGEFFNLSMADFDFFVTGATLSHMGNTVALISNDIPILHTWNCFVREKELNRERFGFFIREDINRFDMARV
ncbi:MAG TPA: hypothetical protein VJZ93_02240 [Candidatus Nanoarchaeia archaeon]|nr:hypothetical protein [Candidatus Nanoarchaeia archaeon]